MKKQYFEQIQKVKEKGIQNLKRVRCELENPIEIFFGEPVIYEFNIDGVLFELFTHLKPESPFLYVFSPTERDPKRHSLPYFVRWSWAVKCPYSAISLNDPTLSIEDVNVGWFQGTKENYYLPTTCEIIRSLATHINISSQNILFCGSSAGGFTSLMMAAYVRSAAFVVNPQTDLTRDRRYRLDPILQKTFSGISPEEARDKFLSRLSISAYYRSVNYIPKICYLQNTTDTFHWETHYLPFIKSIGEMNSERDDWMDRVMIQSELYCHGNHPQGSQLVSYEHWMSRCENFMKMQQLS